MKGVHAAPEPGNADSYESGVVMLFVEYVHPVMIILLFRSEVIP